MDHFRVIRFIKILIEQLGHRANIALQPHFQRVLIERFPVERVNQPHLFAGFRVSAQQHLRWENHRHHRRDMRWAIHSTIAPSDAALP
ncbi:Uncharacterised protein [Raoultella terrigena]|uniref:Uncharacterized protein n=1 Tax=Raoultella terrigena TaxID=577 RepID=A0A4U9CY85_RAOTE|nr:Uncharacterised protein [Raoultella terrigena]